MPVSPARRPSNIDLMSSRRASSSATGSLRQLAARYVNAQLVLRRAGCALHDDVAPPLAAAGLLLSLVKKDFPETAASVDEAASAMETAMAGLRALVRELNPSPVDRLGLKNALALYAERDSRIRLEYTAQGSLPRAVAATLFDLVTEALQAAAAAKAICIRVSGRARISIRISSSGGVMAAEFLFIMEELARKSGITVRISSKRSTIVSILYAGRRSVGR